MSMRKTTHNYNNYAKEVGGYHLSHNLSPVYGIPSLCLLHCTVHTTSTLVTTITTTSSTTTGTTMYTAIER